MVAQENNNSYLQPADQHLRPASASSMQHSTTTTQYDTASAVPSVLDKERGDVYDSQLPSETGSHTEKEEPKHIDEKAADIEAGNESDGEIEYPKSWKLFLISLALCLSVFCMALDNTIIATAIPRITDDFGALNDVGWYGSAYLLTTCALQLIFGKLYTYYSIKWVYMIALFIFEVGSAVCGAAPNSVALIVGRAIAGIGSAGIFSGAILIIAKTVPLHKRPTFTGMIGGMYGIASVAGPLMGGAFTDSHLTWRWCFYINLPFGAVTGLFIFFFFKSPKSAKAANAGFRKKLEQFDLTGTALFLPGVICLLLALQWGGSKYEWKSARIIVLLVLFGVCMIGFVAVQIWKQELATVPPRVFKDRNVWGSALFASMLGAAFFVLVYYIPIWFQAIKGVSAVKSGIMNLPMILGLVIVSIVSGGAVTVTGYYTPFIYASTVLMAIGAGLLTTFDTDTHHSKWIGYQFIFGAGVGFGMQQTLMAVQTVLPDADVPIGTATLMFAQTLGGALFISVGQNVFTNQLIKNLANSVPEFPSYIVLATGATELKRAIDPVFLPRVLEAYNLTLIQTWYVSVATAVVSAAGAAVIQWKSMKGKKVAAVPAA